MAVAGVDRQFLFAVEDAEACVFDDDGDDFARVSSSDPKSLPRNHGHAICWYPS